MSPQLPPACAACAAPTEPTDRELLQRTRGGDDEAFAALWRRHHGPLCRWARTMTTRFEADELVSEAFVRLLQAIRNGRGPETAARAYLRAVMRNLSMEWARRAVPVVTMDGYDDLLVAEDLFAGVDDAADRSSAVRVFQSLPDTWQRVLWLGDVEGLPPREIATALGMNSNAVSALRFRAVHGFRRAYAATAEPAGRVA
ncbi:RNA polymerase sigma factor [Agromyces sp. NPDC055658]